MLVRSIIFVVVMVVLGALLKARRANARETPDGYVLEYTQAWRWMALGGLLLPLMGLFAVLAAGHVPRTPGDWKAFAGLVGFFLVLGGWLTLETYRRRFRLLPEGLAVRTPWSSEQVLPWAQLSGVRARPAWQELELRFGRRKVGLSRYLSGLESLAEALRRYAPAQVSSPDALHIVLAHVGTTPAQMLAPRRPSARSWVDRLRDATGYEYEAVTDAFEPRFTHWVASWPVVCVLPMGEGTRGAHLEPLLASLLRRDLGVAGPVSVLGGEETGTLTFRQLLEYMEQPEAGPLRWKHVAAVGCEIRDGAVTLRGCLWSVEALSTPRDFHVQGRGEDLGALTAELAARFARALELFPSSAAQARWREGRPRSLQSLEATARACDANDVAWLGRALATGEAHPDALALVDLDGHGAEGEAALLAAAAADPSDAQLCFLYGTRLWKGQGRDSAAARALVAGLQAAPGHGKSQMCLAHMFEQMPRNAERILAHAEAGERLLPGNPYAVSNFLDYLHRYAPQDPRRGRLIERMLAEGPDHPAALCTAMDFYIERGEAPRALQLARHFEQLCTPPVSPDVLYALRQNPAMAAALDAGELTPLDEARRCVAICEEAVRKQSN
jgi:hypothetical protein